MRFLIILVLINLIGGNMETLDFFKKHHSYEGATTPEYVKNLKLKLEDLERRLRSVEQPGIIKIRDCNFINNRAPEARSCIQVRKLLS